jgi:hypothetical protein
MGYSTRDYACGVVTDLRNKCENGSGDVAIFVIKMNLPR